MTGQGKLILVHYSIKYVAANIIAIAYIPYICCNVVILWAL